MGKIVGHQDLWKSGSHLFIRRDPVDGANQPWLDLGSIDVAQPNLEIEKVQAFDSDGGVKKLLAEALDDLTESYDITGKNLSPELLAFVFSAKPPTEFAQSAAEAAINHAGYAGRLLGIVDTDGNRVNMLSTVAAVTSAAVSGGVLSTVAITAMSKSGKTITTSSDISSDLSAGDAIAVQATGLANILNSRTYTVASVSTNTITIEESPAADEAAITGSLIYAASGDSGAVYLQDTDWEKVDYDRGFIRLIDGGAISSDGTVHVIYSTSAVSGLRQIDPQSAKGTVEADFELYFGREGNDAQTVRRGRCSITPSSTNFTDDDFSTYTLTLSVLNDLTAATPAGSMTYIKGALPAKS